MPHLTGDPLLCMTSNQVRVYKAYGSVPVWLDSKGALQCTYCNSGSEGCQSSCLMATVMNKMRADVQFLEAEEARKGIPVTHEEMADRFHKFCHSSDVQVLVSGDRLYSDFVEKHKIVLLLQSLSPWLKKEADRYAAAGGVHNQSKERLSLKCERAVTQFLRLDLESMTEEDTIILCNAIETSGFYNLDTAQQNAIQCMLDLLSVVNAVKETQRSNAVSLFQQLQDEQEQEKLLPPQVLQSNPSEVNAPMTEGTFSSEGTMPIVNSPMANTANSRPVNGKPTSSSSFKTNFGKTQPPKSTKSSKEISMFDEEFADDDPSLPNRCRGRTKAGVRCKLTEESVGKLHGRCAEAAEPLSRGAKYCKFHRDQEPLF